MLSSKGRRWRHFESPLFALPCASLESFYLLAQVILFIDISHVILFTRVILFIGSVILFVDFSYVIY